MAPLLGVISAPAGQATRRCACTLRTSHLPALPAAGCRLGRNSRFRLHAAADSPAGQPDAATSVSGTDGVAPASPAIATAPAAGTATPAALEAQQVQEVEAMAVTATSPPVSRTRTAKKRRVAQVAPPPPPAAPPAGAIGGVTLIALAGGALAIGAGAFAYFRRQQSLGGAAAGAGSKVRS